MTKPNTRDLVTLAIFALFGVLLLDFFVLAPFGARLLPLAYGTSRILVLAMGIASGFAAILALRRQKVTREGLLAAPVPLHVAVSLLLAPVALASLAGFFGTTFWLMDLFSMFRLQYTLLLGAGFLLLLALRQGKWAAGLALFLLPNLVAVAPYVVSWPRAEADPRGPSVRLVLANVNTLNRDYDKVKSFLLETDADVVVLEEIDSVWVEALAELDQRYPHSLKVPLRSNFGIALWSRLPLKSAESVTFALPGTPSIVASVDVEGKTLHILGTHPLPPRDAKNTALRDQQLLGIASLAAKSGPYAVVLGDLNTTPWGSAFRGMVRESGL